MPEGLSLEDVRRHEKETKHELDQLRIFGRCSDLGNHVYVLLFGKKEVAPSDKKDGEE
ncbi:unnamed protein product [Clavelina lepadiformis]|uniref:Uncharacterized protein n=1 Tax=Clavelina lepadiformis TaxID=159417 RepID=A0ABP0G5R0_CLALP